MVAEGKVNMTKEPHLSAGAGPNVFGEGAARLAEMARAVKARQLAELQGAAGPSGAVAIDAPDEAWSRKFASQAIGPTGADALKAMAPVWHAPAIVPDLASLRASVTHSQEFSRKMDAGLGGKPEGLGLPISERLGREDRPRRSWLARLFRGA